MHVCKCRNSKSGNSFRIKFNTPSKKTTYGIFIWRRFFLALTKTMRGLNTLFSAIIISILITCTMRLAFF